MPIKIENNTISGVQTISSNSVTTLSLDSSGRVFFPNRPVGLMYKSTTSQALGSSTNLIAMTSNSQLQGGVSHDSVNSRLTVPSTGLYYVYVMVSGSNTGTPAPDDGVRSWIRKNGTMYAPSGATLFESVYPFFSCGAVGGEEWSTRYAIPVNLSAADYIDVIIENLSSTGVVVEYACAGLYLLG